MTAPEWRDCADPDELAAAVAAGVEVLRMRNRGEWSRSVLSESKDFAFRIGRGDRYRVPDGWSPEPPADDLRERIARAAAGGYMRVPIVALDGMYLGPPWLDVADAVLAVLPTPPPTPPWPGAVLSGLVDEDGVPTWLAQAGQVRGEQVRIWHGEPWVTTHGSWADSRWVEVRAPRAVPEPETERVPWWKAPGRLVPEGLLITAASFAVDDVGASDGPIVTTRLGHLVPWLYSGDGTPTVEVLKDGDR